MVYTTDSKISMLEVDAEELAQARSTTPEHATILAQGARSALGADWGIGETGVAGPTPNSRGISPGTACVAVVGPGDVTSAPLALLRDCVDRGENMEAFAAEALEVLHAQLVVLDQA